MRLPRESLLAYLTGQRVLVNVPLDARLVSVWMEINAYGGIETGARMVLKLEHPSFPAVKPGTRIPRMLARFIEVCAKGGK